MATTTLAIPWADFWCTRAQNAALGAGPERSVELSDQERMSVPMMNKDERAQFNEVFVPHLPEAYASRIGSPVVHLTPRTLCRKTITALLPPGHAPKFRRDMDRWRCATRLAAQLCLSSAVSGEHAETPTGNREGQRMQPQCAPLGPANHPSGKGSTPRRSVRVDSSGKYRRCLRKTTKALPELWSDVTGISPTRMVSAKGGGRSPNKCCLRAVRDAHGIAPDGPKPVFPA
jgi:hypothetical protein